MLTLGKIPVAAAIKIRKFGGNKNMFKLVLSDVKLFKNAFDAISSIVDEVVCVIDSEGFRVTAMDRSHIVFCGLDLKPTVFDEFECTVPDKITIDTDEFMKILKRAKGNDTLTLSSDEGNVIIKFTGDVDREFKIRLIDIEYESPQPPALNPPVSVEVPSELVNECLKDMALFSEKVYFMVDENYFKAITDGEFGDAEVAYLHGDNILEVVKSCYSVPKLQEMFKASKFSDIVEVALGTDMPLTLKFKLVSDDGEMSFLLAPRLEEVE